jgi:hypothetical protein
VARLEYRLLDETRGFPVLYYYDQIERMEVSMRFACYYFVKDRTVYERASCAIEEQTFVIYVTESEEEKVLDLGAPHPVTGNGIRVELREYKEDTALYPVVHEYKFHSASDALLHLQSDFLYVGGREWKMTSTEIDEDRRTYVIYAQPTS